MGTSFTAIRAMFYLLSPSETYFERMEDVPDYVVKVSSGEDASASSFDYFQSSLGDSTLLYSATTGSGHCLVSWKDNATIQRHLQLGHCRYCLTCASVRFVLMGNDYHLRFPSLFVFSLFLQSVELSAYIWIYEHCRVFRSLPWNSPLTYWVAFLGIDFGYYWFHRMAHGKDSTLLIDGTALSFLQRSISSGLHIRHTTRQRTTTCPLHYDKVFYNRISPGYSICRWPCSFLHRYL